MYKLATIWIAFLLIASMLLTACDEQPGEELHTGNIELSPIVTNFTKLTDAEKQEAGWLPAGYYTIGKDIPAGEYYFIATGERDEYGQFGSVVFDISYNFEVDGGTLVWTFTYYTVPEDVRIHVNNAWFIPAQDAPIPQSEDGLCREGMYKVGRDIPEGKYKVMPDSGKEGYAAILSSTEGERLDNTIQSRMSKFKWTVKVSDGQYLDVAWCSIQQI